MKDIVVCCGEMLRALSKLNDPKMRVRTVWNLKGEYIESIEAELEDHYGAIKFCPWCGAELPFPYKKDKP